MTTIQIIGTIASVHSHPGTYFLTIDALKPTFDQVVVAVSDAVHGLDQDALAEALHEAVHGGPSRDSLIGMRVTVDAAETDGILIASPSDIVRTDAWRTFTWKELGAMHRTHPDLNVFDDDPDMADDLVMQNGVDGNWGLHLDSVYNRPGDAQRFMATRGLLIDGNGITILFDHSIGDAYALSNLLDADWGEQADFDGDRSQAIEFDPVDDGNTDVSALYELAELLAAATGRRMGADATDDATLRADALRWLATRVKPEADIAVVLGRAEWAEIVELANEGAAYDCDGCSTPASAEVTDKDRQAMAALRRMIAQIG